MGSAIQTSLQARGSRDTIRRRGAGVGLDVYWDGKLLARRDDLIRGLRWSAPRIHVGRSFSTTRHHQQQRQDGRQLQLQLGGFPRDKVLSLLARRPSFSTIACMYYKLRPSRIHSCPSGDEPSVRVVVLTPIGTCGSGNRWPRGSSQAPLRPCRRKGWASPGSEKRRDHRGWVKENKNKAGTISPHFVARVL